MLKKMTLLAGAMVVSTTAHAQYAPYPPAEPYVPYGDVPQDTRVFSGVRIEAHLSYDRLKPDLLADDDPFVTDKRDGLGYGGEVGFDLPVGPLTLGGYASVDGSTVRECQRPAGNIAGGVTLCVRDGRNIAAGGRIGFPVTHSLLLFAKGGYSNGLIRAERSQAVLNGYQVYRQKLDGYHVGGGVEAAFGGGTYGKVEYIYTRLRKFNASSDPDNARDFDRQQVQGAVGVRF